MRTLKKYFGTDGIRGKTGETPIHPEFVLKLGWAAGKVLSDNDHNKIVIGKDPRISGYLLESVLQAGLSAAGVNSRLLGPMPTPAIAYLTRTLRAEGGIVISASHNPYTDNGIKFFTAEGYKISDEIELAIESYLDKPMTMVESSKLGKAFRIDDAQGRYIEFCKSTVPMRTCLNGLKIVLDCANGATYHIAPNVFRELGAEVIAIGVEPDGLNINHLCGSTYPDHLKKVVLESNADLGIAFDGDGDRVIMIDHKGELVDGDHLLFIMVEHVFARQDMQGGVVGTVMTNTAFELAFKERGIPFIRSAVGDRHVMASLQKQGWFWGGESSGHIICLHKTTSGDGIVAALQVLYAMMSSGQSLFDLKSKVVKHPQYLCNIPCEQPNVISQKPSIKTAVTRLEKQYGHVRILLRPSGTESKIRVMVESEQADQACKIADYLAELVESHVLKETS